MGAHGGIRFSRDRRLPNTSAPTELALIARDLGGEGHSTATAASSSVVVVVVNSVNVCVCVIILIRVNNNTNDNSHEFWGNPV